MRRTLHLLALLVVASPLLSGCVRDAPSPAPTDASQHDDHGHDHAGHDGDHPETFAAVVAELAEKRDAIKAALTANDLRKADGPVHAVGHLLEDLGDLANDTGLSVEQQATVKSAQQTLFAAFAGLDETIHGEESGKTWFQVRDDINQSIASLQELAAQSEQEGSEE